LAETPYSRRAQNISVRVAAIVLAAGKSERMGRPKALLPFRGRTFLENILRAISGSKIEHTQIVLGHNHELIARSVALTNVIINPSYERGMTTSFQAGIRSLPSGMEGAVIFLVDHPVVEPATIDALIQRGDAGGIVLPTYRGRRGHPVLFGRAVLDEILALPETIGANSVVWRDPKRITEVEVDDPGLLIDVDTPEQYEELLRRN
jgi:molybdenum cofactor cytidylyltransferase